MEKLILDKLYEMSNKLEGIDNKLDKLDIKLSEVEKKLDFISDKTMNLKNLKHEIIESVIYIQEIEKATITNCYDIAKLRAVQFNNSK
ncbi:hypothetical protein [Clostridium thermobutyricum]|uniref:hypothetical protein n=1 Tax=Clostridium thermobutyricum TaxID=29372 RepID=UPI0018AA2B3B|nr:hypothetical protein [Clostridium thermobutyricum]